MKVSPALRTLSASGHRARLSSDADRNSTHIVDPVNARKTVPLVTVSDPIEENYSLTQSAITPDSKKSSHWSPFFRKVKEKATRHTTTLVTGLPGFQRTIDRPLRTAPPEPVVHDDLHTEEPPLLAASRKLLHSAQAACDSLREEKVSLWQRPAPSKSRRRLLRLFPWLKPASLTEVAAVYSHSKTSDSISPAGQNRQKEVTQAAENLLTTLDEQRIKLEAAIDVLAHYTAGKNPPSGQMRSSAESTLIKQVQLAEEQVARLSAELNASLQSPAILSLFKSHQFALTEQQTSDFSQQRLRELKQEAQSLLKSGRELAEPVSEPSRVDQRKYLANKNPPPSRQDLQKESDKQHLILVTALSAEINAAREQIIEAEQHIARLQARGDQLSLERLTPDEQAEKEQIDAELLQYLLIKNISSNRILDKTTQLEDAEHQVAEIESVLDLGQTADIQPASSIPLQALPSPESSRDVRQQISHARQALTVLKQAPQARPYKHPAEIPVLNQLKQQACEAVLEPIRLRKDPQLVSQLEKHMQHLLAHPELSKQPPWLMAEVVISVLDVILPRGNQRAGEIVTLLANAPVDHWLDPQKLAPSEKEVYNLLAAFCHRVSTLPRGADLLQLFSSQNQSPPDAEISRALGVFWNADMALQQESDPQVKTWLNQAKQVAKSKLEKTEETFDNVALSAYNAVRNGYLSCAPGSLYDRDNKRLLKATHEWVFRAMSYHGFDVKGAWQQLKASPHKTPFHEKNLDHAMDISQSMGMGSMRSRAEQVIRQQLTDLEELLQRHAHHFGHQLPQTGFETLVQLLKSQSDNGQHLSRMSLDNSLLRAVRRKLPAQQGLSARFTQFSGIAVTETLPDLLPQLSTQKLSIYEALEQIKQHLNTAIPPEQRVTESHQTEQTQKMMSLLKTRHFKNKEDILTFFKPLIEECRLRDRVRLKGGWAAGAGLPQLPFSIFIPVAPLFSYMISRRREAHAQLFMPILGMEMSFSSVTTVGGEFTLGAAAGPDVLDVRMQAGTRGYYQQQKTKTEATLLRFFRRRFYDDEMRQKMYTSLESMVRWDQLEAKPGQTYSGPLEAVLARSPDVSLSHLNARSDVKNFQLTPVFVRLPLIRNHLTKDTSQLFSDDLSLSQEHEKSVESRQEGNGAIKINNYKANTTHQRTRLNLMANFLPIANSPSAEEGDNAGTRMFGVPLQLGAAFDLSWQLERNEISLYAIDDKQDADLDRHYSSVKDMQKEIISRRDEWLMRCIETLEPDATKRNDPSLRKQATLLLEEFEETIAQLPDQSHYNLYNINYSLRGETGAEIDSYRALAQLAEQQGDTTRASQMQQHIDTLLKMRESWRPLMLIIRERVSDNISTGIKYGVRAQKLRGNDGMRTVAQFPPP